MKNQNDETLGKLIILNNESRSIKNRVKQYENNSYKIPKINQYQNSRNANISARISPNKNKNYKVKIKIKIKMKKKKKKKKMKK